jgi:hypothetical protein
LIKTGENIGEQPNKAMSKMHAHNVMRPRESRCQIGMQMTQVCCAIPRIIFENSGAHGLVSESLAKVQGRIEKPRAVG